MKEVQAEHPKSNTLEPGVTKSSVNSPINPEKLNNLALHFLPIHKILSIISKVMSHDDYKKTTGRQAMVSC
jgi:hypothetical protein